jgi:hypothetical protein
VAGVAAHDWSDVSHGAAQAEASSDLIHASVGGGLVLVTLASLAAGVLAIVNASRPLLTASRQPTGRARVKTAALDRQDTVRRWFHAVHPLRYARHLVDAPALVGFTRARASLRGTW